MDAVGLEMAASWVCSAVSCVSIWYYGNKQIYGPAIGLVSQLGWWAFTLAGAHWGLVPLNLIMGYIHYRNIRKYQQNEG